MPIRNAHPVSFFAQGLSDALDQQSAFPGACQSLANSVFDRATRGAISSRPGVTAATTFAGFSTPSVISVMITVGTRIYGMIGTARNAGFDEPFVYDTVANSFVTVSGVVAGNVPTTQATTGAWTPPTMDVVGTKVLVTHPGFSGANFFGSFDISVPATPAWSAGNTTVNALPSKPQWVVAFFNRAYFGVNNAVYFSDSLSALTISATNFAGVLTLGDTSSTTGASGLAFSTSSAGILSSLVIFKPSSIYQISGDITGTGSTALSLNTMSANIGCTAPRTAASTPTGVYFVASDGPRQVDLKGQLQHVKRDDSVTPDIVSPFTNATTPSRACASYNNSVYRVCLDTIVMGTAALGADYWYDSLFSRWNGVHTFPYHAIVPLGQSFYLASNTSPGTLFKSDVTQSATSVYTDNAVAYTSVAQTTLLTDPEAMAVLAIVESTLEISKKPPTSTYTITATDDQGNQLNSVAVSYVGSAATWGTGVWGTAVWTYVSTSTHPATIAWSVPLVFKKIAFQITSPAAATFALRELKIRAQKLGYTNT